MLWHEMKRRNYKIYLADGAVGVAVEMKLFTELLCRALVSVEVDEEWYLDRYPDVAEAVAAKQLENAKQHFVTNGYFEGRLPGPISVDEDWYLSTYADVREAVERGDVASAKAHFYGSGAIEGRLPCEGFDLFSLKQPRSVSELWT